MAEESPRIIEIDMRGQVCPSTLLVALNSIDLNRKELRNGLAKLLIRTDNRDATTTIPATAENMGYQIEVAALDGFYEILISSPA
jgi:TusA-related sulfurtransferase